MYYLIFIRFHTVCSDGSVIAVLQNPAVSEDLLKEILHWTKQGATATDIITQLRLRTAPSGYPIHIWHKGAIIQASISDMHVT